MTDSGFHFVEELTELQIHQLHRLTQQQWWGKKRTLDDLKLMVEHSSLMIALVESSTQQLVGFCRVLTDFVFRATIYDVMIAENLQGKGWGRRMLNELHQHPRLKRVSFIYLACEPELFAFYGQWGFGEYQGRAQWMIKVQREE